MSGPLGFFGATPINQPGTYSAGWNSADRAAPSYTAQPLSTPFTGGLLDLLQAARLADLNTVRLATENNRVFAEATRKQLNALIDDLRALGLIG